MNSRRRVNSDVVRHTMFPRRLLSILIIAVACACSRSASPNLAKSAPTATPDPCSFVPTGNEKITPSQAGQLAECFVIQNGYTDLPPMADLSKLSYETFNDGPPPEKALELRRNTLERTAWGVAREGAGKDRVWQKDGWTVAFRYHPNIEGRVRVVTMDAYGQYLRMQHPDYPPGMFKKPDELAPER
jgi:hypothetical protein